MNKYKKDRKKIKKMDENNRFMIWDINKYILLTQDYYILYRGD